jgi:tRNA nucleotidyltransferase/poly(A) polymerase
MESTNPYKKFQINKEIQITPLEQKIFDELMDVVKDHQLKTTLRVAGGWVRDKVSNIGD